MPILANKQNMIRVTPSPDTWVRPTDWVEIPSITSADTKFYGVYAVYETRKNNVYIGFASGAFNCTINWGDGTPNTTATTVSTVSKTYTYSGITSPILQDSYGEKYKTVLVTITQNSGAVTQFNFGSSTSIGTYNWLDIVMSWSTARVQFLKAHPLLQRFIMYSGSFSSANINNYINYLNSCRVFQIPTSIGTPTSAAAFLSWLGNTEIGDITISGNIATNSLFSNSLVRKIGNVTASSSTTVTSMFASCLNLQQVGNVNLASGTSFSSLFINCINLIKVGTITSTSMTNMSNMFSNCVAIREITFTSLANVTTTGSPFASCHSLKKLRVPDLKVSFSLVDCALERDDLVQVFTDLGTPAISQTITVTRNPGAADLTAADILIATSKNWTVTL